MDDPVASAILNQYFHRLEEALSGLPADRRQQILEDLRAHVTESLADEADVSDASVLAVLDRLGDPDEIAREALADGAEGAVSAEVSTRRSLAGWPTTRLGGLVTLAIAAVAAIGVVILAVTDGSPSAAATHATVGTRQPGWLPASQVTGDHQSPGASYCSPQTVSGSESASALEADASEVASGRIDGHSWSLWSRHGQSGANALETGGIVVDGVAHGLCPGFANPAEMELLDPSGGGAGLVYGVVGYSGAAKVDVYRGVVETFSAGKLLATVDAQVVNGVGFFIAALPASACSYRSLELNTKSKDASAEHNLGFSTGNCSAGELVPISWSQGVWGGGGPGVGGGSAVPVTRNGWLPASDVSGDHQSPGASYCSPQTVSGSEPASALEADASEVASGRIDGHSWSLWSRHGQSGANALETGGIVVDGVAHGLCPAFPNPAEMELLDPSGGSGLVYGVVGYSGAAKVDVYRGVVETFSAGKLLVTAHAQVVNGVGFFIAALPGSACSYRSLEMNSTSKGGSAEHNLGFDLSRCSAGQLVPINWSQGIWGLSPGQFQNGFSGQRASIAPATKGGWLPASDVSGDHHSQGGSYCAPQTVTGSESASALETDASEVASGTVDGHSWSLWSRHGQTGANALETGGIVVDGTAHGLCPGFPNPAEMELLDPSGGGPGLAYGVVGYRGTAKVDIYRGAGESFGTGKLLATATARAVNGVGFFITALPASGCSYRWLEMNTTSKSYSTQHNLGFSLSHCSAGQLVPIDWSQGVWALPPGRF